jgi:hypothetical protein
LGRKHRQKLDIHLSGVMFHLIPSSSDEGKSSWGSRSFLSDFPPPPRFAEGCERGDSAEIPKGGVEAAGRIFLVDMPSLVPSHPSVVEVSFHVEIRSM